MYNTNKYSITHVNTFQLQWNIGPILSQFRASTAGVVSTVCQQYVLRAWKLKELHSQLWKGSSRKAEVFFTAKNVEFRGL